MNPTKNNSELNKVSNLRMRSKRRKIVKPRHELRFLKGTEQMNKNKIYIKK